MCMSNATGPLTACVAASLPQEARPGGLALWNSVASVGGYLGPATFGWLKGATGRNSPGMVVRCPPVTSPQHDPLATSAANLVRQATIQKSRSGSTPSLPV